VEREQELGHGERLVGRPVLGEDQGIEVHEPPPAEWPRLSGAARVPDAAP
jgi:hypothetical protein